MASSKKRPAQTRRRKKRIARFRYYGVATVAGVALVAVFTIGNPWAGAQAPSSESSAQTASDSAPVESSMGERASAGNSVSAEPAAGVEATEGADGTMWVTIAIALSLLAIGISGGAFWASLRRPSDPAVGVGHGRETTMSPPPLERQDHNWLTRPAPTVDEFRALKDQVAELEYQLERLRRASAKASLEVPVATASVAAVSAAEPIPHPAGTILQPSNAVPESLHNAPIPGSLSQNDEVRVSNASRPMVEIRWAAGESTAEVWINPNYKFADLTADYLLSAFEVDGGGPGSYETIVPARIDWSAGASAGRVRTRGRARALDV